MSTTNDSEWVVFAVVALMQLGLMAYVYSCVKQGSIWLGSRWGSSYPERIERAKEPARFKQVLWSFIIFEALFFPLIIYWLAAALWPDIKL